MMMSKKIPMRRCVSCREVKRKEEFLRVVKTSDENFQLDFSGKAQGRGAYICKNLNCAANAKKRRGFDKSFKKNVPAEIYDEIISAIENLNHE